MRDVSGDRLELVRLRENQSRQTAQLENLRALLDLSSSPSGCAGRRKIWSGSMRPMPMRWTPRTRATRWRAKLELLDRQALDAVTRAREAGMIWRQRQHLVVAGERRLMEAFDDLASGGAGGVATDLSELESLRANHARQMESHIRTLDQLADRRGDLRPWQKAGFRQRRLSPALVAGPRLPRPASERLEILDRLRAARRLPEQADYRAWKNALLDLYHTLDPAAQVWHLPDGRTLRVGFDPNPQGGITYIFDDVTERFTLESQYNALARVQSETLEALQEGVAVFGDRRAPQLVQSGLRPHLAPDAWRNCRQAAYRRGGGGLQPLLPDDAAWADLRSVVAGLHDARMGFQRRMAAQRRRDCRLRRGAACPTAARF